MFTDDLVNKLELWMILWMIVSNKVMENHNIISAASYERKSITSASAEYHFSLLLYTWRTELTSCATNLDEFSKMTS